MKYKNTNGQFADAQLTCVSDTSSNDIYEVTLTDVKITEYWEYNEGGIYRKDFSGNVLDNKWSISFNPSNLSNGVYYITING